MVCFTAQSFCALHPVLVIEIHRHGVCPALACPAIIPRFAADDMPAKPVHRVMDLPKRHSDPDLRLNYVWRRLCWFACRLTSNHCHCHSRAYDQNGRQDSDPLPANTRQGNVHENQFSRDPPSGLLRCPVLLLAVARVMVIVLGTEVRAGMTRLVMAIVLARRALGCGH
jgi:hypothetical protein